MTVKERLGKARKLVSDYAKYHKSDSVILTDYGIELIEWLIEQSEKVEELELEVNAWRAEVQKWQKFYKESEESHSETKELLKSIVNQNKRYREALEEIMRTETVTTALAEGQVAYTFSGHIARQALEGDEI